MTGKIIAPFTSNQVDALNAFQRLGYVHPFTCPGHKSAGDRNLVATRGGWICCHCDYRQTWAHAGILNPPDDPTAALRREAASQPTDQAEDECIDFALLQLCGFLGVDPQSVSWDAATETRDGDVRAVIGNILRAKFGEEWDPKAAPSQHERLTGPQLKVDWVNCPICDEPDMRKETFDGDLALIDCTNHGCASNGAPNDQIDKARAWDAIAEKNAEIDSLRKPPDAWALSALISEDWLKSVGFKWHQLDRQPSKHWLLWLGSGLNEGASLTSYEDIGIELTDNPPGRDGRPPEWFCWFRGDAAGRYHRFIHLRHLTMNTEVIRLVEAITGYPFDPANNMYGSVHTPRRAAAIREEDAKRLDRQMLEASPHQKWSDVEKDDTRGRALPEHLEAHEKRKAQP